MPKSFKTKRKKEKIPIVNFPFIKNVPAPVPPQVSPLIKVRSQFILDKAIIANKIADGSITGVKLDSTGFGKSNKQLLNYVIRENPSAVDYSTTTHNATWTDWDLTSLTSSTAVSVLFGIKLVDDTVGSYVALRQNSEGTGSQDTQPVVALVASQNIYAQRWVECDGGQVVERLVIDAAGTPVSVTTLEITVLAWLEPAQV